MDEPAMKPQKFVAPKKTYGFVHEMITRGLTSKKLLVYKQLILFRK